MDGVFNIITTTCWISIVLISLPLNILCLIVLGKVRDIEDTTKLFLKSLTVADILFCLLRGIPAITAAVGNAWPFGDLTCLLIPIPRDSVLFAAFMSLLAVNIDRCIVIVYPLRYPALINVNKVWILVVLSWCTSFLLIMSLAMISKWKVSYSFYEHACHFAILRNQTTDEFYAIYVAIWYWLPGAIVFLVIICFILVIGTSLRLRFKALKISNRHVHDRVQSHNRRAATTFFLMTLSQVAVNIPWILKTILRKEFTFFETFSSMMYTSGGIWNVIVYYLRNQAFKHELNRLLFHFRLRRGNRTVYSVTNASKESRR